MRSTPVHIAHGGPPRPRIEPLRSVAGLRFEHRSLGEDLGDSCSRIQDLRFAIAPRSPTPHSKSSAALKTYASLSIGQCHPLYHSLSASSLQYVLDVPGTVDCRWRMWVSPVCLGLTNATCARRYSSSTSSSSPFLSATGADISSSALRTSGSSFMSSEPSSQSALMKSWSPGAGM